MPLRAWAYNRFIMGDAALRIEAAYQEITRYHPRNSNDALRAALEHASRHVPFYRNRGTDLHSHFIIRKKDVRANYERMIAEDIDRANCHEVHTSGSTGTPLTMLHDTATHDWIRATELYFFRDMLGLDPAATPMVVFWASSPSIWGQRRDLRKRFSLWLTQTSLLGATRFTPEEMHQAVETINRRKPLLIKGYSTPLYEVAKHIRKNNIRIHQPRIVFTLAETLHDYMREEIQNVFGCPVRDFYGTRELGPIAGECSHGRMHLFQFNVFTELLDNAGAPAESGKEARIVITSLRNRAMPLVRYDTEDAAIPDEGICPCGNPLPTVAKVLGRLVDFFVAPGGTLVWGGYFNRLLYSQDWITDYQVEQFEMNCMVVTFISDRTPTAAEKLVVEEKTRLVMGPACAVEWRRVEELPALKNGKRHYTVSYVHPR